VAVFLEEKPVKPVSVLEAQRTIDRFMDEMDKVHPDWLRKK
jgi:hypothetical protein